MYQKVVIPWDGSAEAQGVLPHVRDEVEAEGEVVFLRVASPKTDEGRGGRDQGRDSDEL